MFWAYFLSDSPTTITNVSGSLLCYCIIFQFITHFHVVSVMLHGSSKLKCIKKRNPMSQRRTNYLPIIWALIRVSTWRINWIVIISKTIQLWISHNSISDKCYLLFIFINITRIEIEMKSCSQFMIMITFSLKYSRNLTNFRRTMLRVIY